MTLKKLKNTSKKNKNNNNKKKQITGAGGTETLKNYYYIYIYIYQNNSLWTFVGEPLSEAHQLFVKFHQRHI